MGIRPDTPAEGYDVRILLCSVKGLRTAIIAADGIKRFVRNISKYETAWNTCALGKLRLRQAVAEKG